MTLLALVLATLSAAADAVPAPVPAPAPAAAPRPPAASTAPATPEQLADARGALLGPCAMQPESAGGTLTAVSLVDGDVVNAAIAKEKIKRNKAWEGDRFLAITYRVGDKVEKDFRQVQVAGSMTNQQAQVLLGEKVCVIRYGL
jgi:hypothetical protein